MTPRHVFAALPLVLVLAAAARAADPQGPPIGGNGYAAAIKTFCSVPDIDDYVGTLVKGEKLTVSVAAKKGSTLVPRLTLIAPDGSEFVPPTLAAHGGGKSLSLRSFEIPATGRWGVRIAGANGTEGAYSIAFAIVPAPKVSVHRTGVGGSSDTVVAFEGIDGALLSVSVAWKGKATPITASVMGPNGRPLTGVVPNVGKNSLSLKGLTLDRGNGTYELHLANPATAVLCDVSVRVTPRGRPSSKKAVRLTDNEPYLDPLDVPVRGIEGVPVRLHGGNFPADPLPTVRFGNLLGAVMSADGTTIDVVPPAVLDGTTVPVSVTGSDNQSCVRQNYFLCAPMPVIEDLVGADGAPVRALSADGGATLYLRGRSFVAGNTVLFGSSAAVVTNESGTEFQIVTPALSGTVSLRVRDEFGRMGTAPFVVSFFAVPSVTAAVVTGGPYLDGSHAAAGGGAIVRLYGANFAISDVVSVNGAACAVTATTGDTLTITTGAAATGHADVVVTDPLGQSATLEDAFEFSGWHAASSSHTPAPSVVDDFSALSSAVGDLDGDGAADDLVLVSDAGSPGTSSQFTRVLLGQSGMLTDVTASRLPAALSDPAGADKWKASAVALGDLDGNGTMDILIGGAPVPDGLGGAFEVRVFANDGTAHFTRDDHAPRVRGADWACTDWYDSSTWPVLTPNGTEGGAVQAMAIGDLDGDGLADVVLGTDHFRTGALHMPLSNVYFFGDDLYTFDAAYVWDAAGTTVDTPALRIFENEGAGADPLDVTFTRLPGGDPSPGLLPAFHTRDVKLGDIDGDGDLDIVLTWDDPRTVTPYGLAHPGADEPRVATRVLLNDGAGFFTDATDSWMPAGSGNEFWQANRLALADLDGDGRLDLVLLHRESIDAYTGSVTHTASALRILRNDGTRFVDVTAVALPQVPLAGTVDDNLRGTALTVFDFDGDGILDVAVGTTQTLSASSGGAARSMRLLRGTGQTGIDASAFLPAVTQDSGETNGILPCDLGGDGVPSLILLSDTRPAKSDGLRYLRVLDWTK